MDEDLSLKDIVEATKWSQQHKDEAKRRLEASNSERFTVQLQKNW